MTKIRTTITIDEELLNIAHNHKIRISTFLHNSLIEYLGKINGANSLHTAEVAGSNPAKPMLLIIMILMFESRQVRKIMLKYLIKKHNYLFLLRN
ncbi:MAG: hypothetical protein BV457_09545 [Thermoplasmata archaeon M9B1D]|nr:MAG: hypothetical protein BV457_09545 [Thermoplasmata archaeon M9B1D]PNX45769.1 MAG: hypothetical protein BV456_13170 [Thermoplasmata archaeon M8B2D]